MAALRKTSPGAGRRVQRGQATMLQVTLHPGLEVSRYKATAHTGRMELNMHVGSAGRKGYTFLLFQYLCIIKLTKIIIYKKKIIKPAGIANQFLQQSQKSYSSRISSVVGSTAVLGSQ